MGKACHNRKKEEDRPEGDFYSSQPSLIWVMDDLIGKEFDKNKPMFESCVGQGALANPLMNLGFDVLTNDLFPQIETNFDKNYLEYDWDYSQMITNPPFTYWDSFVNKAKTHCDKFMFVGRFNYFGTTSRYETGIWNNLKAVYPFNRYLDFRTPYREDGHFHVGGHLMGWFLWDMEYEGKTTLEIINVQKYATLGAYEENKDIGLKEEYEEVLF